LTSYKQKTTEYNQEVKYLYRVGRMFLTHPLLTTTYAIGAFGMVTAYSLLDDYKKNNVHLRELVILNTTNAHEKHILNTTNAHEKHILENNEKMMYATHAHEKYMLDTKNTHEKQMVMHSHWWKRLF
jgi:hypothetical protein